MKQSLLVALRQRAEAARYAYSRIDPEITVSATRSEVDLERLVTDLEDFFRLDLADDVLELLEELAAARQQLERARLKLARLRTLATYRAQSGLVAAPRFVMPGAEVIAELDREEAGMTLRELMARDVVAVRRLEWAYPNDHVLLTRLEDGTYGPLGEVRSLASPETLGFPAVSHIEIEPLLDTDRWEPYEPKV